VRAVLTLLADARLVTTDQETVEVAHEALIREWPTLREWLREDREGLRLHRRLTEAAQEWVALGREEGLLYRGTRLAQTAEWAAAQPERLNTLEREFLAASRESADREAAEREAQRQQELRAAQQVAEAAQRVAEAERARLDQSTRTAQQLRRRAVYLAGAFFVALVMAGAALFFGEQARRSAEAAQRESRVAYSRELVAAAISNLAADAQRSLLLALEAAAVSQSVGLQPGPDIEDALHRALWALEPGGEALSIPLPDGSSTVAFSPDGTRLAGDTARRQVGVWDAATGALVLAGLEHPQPIDEVAFSPDGNLLATASRDNVARLWDARTGELRLALTGHDNRVNDLAFSSDGRRLATAGEDRVVLIWDLIYGAAGEVEEAQLALSLPSEWPVLTIAYSPDGKQLVAGPLDVRLLVWAAETGQVQPSLPGHHAVISAVAYSPDGAWLATASRNGTIILRDAGTSEARLTLAAPGSVAGLVFSPDGTRLVSADRSGAAVVWEVSSGRELFTLPGSGEPLKTLAFAADGSRLVTAGGDGLHVFLMPVEALLAAARQRLTRSWTTEECQKYLHAAREDCPAPAPTATPRALAPAGARRMCHIADPSGGILNNPFSASMHRGAEAAAERYGWVISYVSPATHFEFDRRIADFIASDCELIMGVLMYDPIRAVAGDHPDQRFMATDRTFEPPLDNVWAQMYAVDQPAFLAGYLAAAVSKTGKVGTFGGVNYVAGVTDFMDGFALGVAYYNERHGTQVEVLGWDVTTREGLFAGGFCCEVHGRPLAAQLIEEGADVILPVAGGVGWGAAREAVEHDGVYVIGVDYDWTTDKAATADVLSVILTSVEKRIDVSVVRAVGAIEDGTFAGGTHVGTLATGEVGLSPFHALEHLVTPALQAELDEIAAGIMAGEIQTLP
jgi:basic membrane lipoprotein Med (substrate-binding protein (PBP1-ABC) superfamily)